MEPSPSNITFQTERQRDRITALDVRDTERVLHLNGIMYVPQPPRLSLERKKSIGQEVENKPWFQKLISENPNFIAGPENIMAQLRNTLRGVWQKASPEYINERREDGGYYIELYDQLLDFYLQYKYKNNGNDPKWLSDLKLETRKVLAYWSVNSSFDEFPPDWKLSPIIYAGINDCAIEKESHELFEDIEQVFRLWRLHSIRQLAYKRDPLPAAVDTRESTFEFTQNRYGHSFDVLAIANLLGMNAKLSPAELKILQIAAITHDFRTPAGGDTTKMIDPEAFDEDKYYNEIFQTKEWREFAIKYRISKSREEKLYQTVLGNGLLGKLLDFSDKLAYVARDLDIYLNIVIRVVSFVDDQEHQHFTEKDNLGFLAIKEIIDSDPLVCSLWDSIEVKDNSIVVNDTERLYRFLKLRALMFKEVYHNPYSRFSVDKFNEQIIRHLYQTGAITKKFLLTNDDGMLEMKISEFIGAQVFYTMRNSFKAVVTNCKDIEEAKELARSAQNDPNQIAIFDDWQVQVNSGTNTFLVKKDGRTLTFSDAYPERAKEIDGIMSSTKQINVYSLNLNDLRIPMRSRPKIKTIFKV